MQSSTFLGGGAHPTEVYTTHCETVLTLTHISSIFHITSVKPSDNLSPIMSRTSNVDQEKGKETVRILLLGANAH